jgi:iron complex transport system substrate-binding protein
MRRLLLLLLCLALPLGAARPQRVVSQTVGTDELLLALADPGQIAALSHIAKDPRFSPVAAEARRYASLRESDAESVLRHRPDLVLVTGYTRPETLALLRRSGVRLLMLERLDRLEDVYDGIRRLAEALEQGPRGDALIAQCRGRIAALEQRLRGARPVRVLSATLYPFTSGSGTSFQDLCDHAGALNVATEAGLRGHAPTPSEPLQRWNPEVLVVVDEPTIVGQLGAIPHYRSLAAFKAGRFVKVPEAMLSSVSHHRIEAYEFLARALHPDRFR